ncbi:MAG: recombinase family protein [Alphaproteobacteria bacterium]
MFLNVSGTKQKAVIYCRVSSQKQVREGHGLESQATRCREYAKHQGYKIVQTYYEEGLSGKLIDRPKMKEMLSFLKKHRKTEEHVVIIDDINRLARDIQAHIHIRSAISEAGGILKSPSIEFGEDSDSRLVEHLLASVAAHQREKNAEQVKNRMRARVVTAYETRIQALEDEKIVLREKIDKCGNALPDFSGTFRTALEFL